MPAIWYSREQAQPIPSGNWAQTMDNTAQFDYDWQAPLAAEVLASRPRDGSVVEDVTFASPRGGKVPAYLIVPQRPSLAGPYAGLIFVHWGEGDREEFVEEASALAGYGVVSLCLDAPYRRPKALRSPAFDPQEAPQEEEIQFITDVRRAVDVLAAQPDVDPQRLGYVGHSYGATFGGVVAGVEKRIKAYVLMAGYVSLTHSYRVTEHPTIARERAATPPEQWEHYLRLLEPLDAVHYIGQTAPAAVFFQFALHDEFITEDEARRYEQAAGDPKVARWYDCGHAFDEQARQDRPR
jgi:dienelactone hydrolase